MGRQGPEMGTDMWNPKETSWQNKVLFWVGVGLLLVQQGISAPLRYEGCFEMNPQIEFRSLNLSAFLPASTPTSEI